MSSNLNCLKTFQDYPATSSHLSFLPLCPPSSQCCFSTRTKNRKKEITKAHPYISSEWNPAGESTAVKVRYPESSQTQQTLLAPRLLWPTVPEIPEHAWLKHLKSEREYQAYNKIAAAHIRSDRMPVRYSTMEAGIQQHDSWDEIWSFWGEFHLCCILPSHLFKTNLILGYESKNHIY